MNLKNVQNLISAPLKPNPSEWAMDVEEVLTDTNKLSEEAKTAIHKTKIHNGAFQNYTDELVAMLKRIVKKEIANKNNDVQGLLYEQSRLSLECRKLYTDTIKESCFIDKSLLGRWYGEGHGGLHHMYIGEIQNAWLRE